jgi:HK97 family phage major capsid protein
MLNDLILAYLKKLTIGSADGRPLWAPGHAFGAPDTIDGFPYLINNDMASTVAVNNITMLFGDMKKYMIRQVNGYIVKRLDERFADFDQTAWLMFARFDGRFANTAAIKKLTQAAV